MKRFTRMGALVAGVAVVLAGAVSAKPPTEPAKPGKDLTRKVVKVKDVTQPGSSEDMKVWRNGKYHTIKVHPRHQVETLEDGSSRERITLDASEIEPQLPAVDPALAAVPPPVNGGGPGSEAGGPQAQGGQKPAPLM